MNYIRIFNCTLLIFWLLVIVCHPVVGQKYKCTVITEGSNFNLCSAHTLRSMSVSVKKSDNTVTLIKSFASYPVTNIREVLYSTTKLIGVKVDATFTRSINNVGSETVTQSYSWSSGGTRIVSGIYQGVYSGGGDCQTSILDGGQVVYLQMEPFYYFKEVNKRIACPGESFGLTLINYDIQGVVNLQVKTSTSGWKDVKPLSVQPYTGIVNISLSDLNSAYAWTNQDLTFQIKYPDGTFSDMFGGFAFLTTPPLTITSTQPTCYGYDDATIRISGFPPNSTGKTLRVDIKQLSTKSSINNPDNSETIPQETHKVEGQDYYWYDAITQPFDIGADGAPIVITNQDIADQNFKLKAGPYYVDAYYEGSLCKVGYPLMIKEPKQVNLNLTLDSYSTVGLSPNTSYDIMTSGGNCIIKGNVSDAIGAPSCFYQLSDGAITPLILGITQLTASANNYKLWAVDGNGCKSPEIIKKLTEPSSIDIDLYSSSVPNCHASNSTEASKKTGSIEIPIIQGGIQPYYYTLEKVGSTTLNPTKNVFAGNMSITISDLEAGAHLLEVFDQYNKIDSQTFNLTKAEMTLSASSTDETCRQSDDGTVTLTVTNGVADYTYSNTTLNPETTQTSNVFTGLGSDATNAKSYSFKVVDGNGCFATTTATINQPVLELSIDTSQIHPPTNATCLSSDGSVTFDISGGWANAAAYPYYIKITTASDEYTTIKDRTITNGGSLSEINFPGLPSGDYKAFVYSNYNSSSGAFACTDDVVFSINEDDPLSKVTITRLRDASCSTKSDGEVTINNLPTTGNYTLTGGVLDVNKKITGLRSGSYTLTLKETTNQCEKNIDITTSDVGVIANPVTFNVDVVQSSCTGVSNGNITLNVTSNYTQYFPTLTYAIDNSAFGDANSFAVTDGIYNVKVKYVEGCVFAQNVTVTPKDNLIQFDVSQISETCDAVDDGKIEIKNILYDGDKSFDVLLYDIDQNPSIFIKEKTNITTNNVLLDSLSHGNYNISIVDADGCALTKSVEVVNANHAPVINSNVIESLACSDAKNGVVDVSVSTPGYTSASFDFSISGQTPLTTEEINSTTYRYSGLNKDLYKIIVKDDKKCPGKLENQKVSINSNLLTINDTIITQSSCKEAKNGQIQISSVYGKPFSYGYDYTISIAEQSKQLKQQGFSTTFSSLEPGTTYQVTVTDSEGCTTINDLVVTQIESPFSINNIKATAAKCNGSEDGTITFDAADWKEGQFYKYSLVNYETNATDYSGSITSKLITGVKGDTYKLLMTSPDTCKSEAVVTVDDPTPITISNEVTKVLDKGQATGSISVEIEGGSGNYNYELIKPLNVKESGTTTKTQLNYPYLGAGTYTLNISDVNNCMYFKDAQGNPTSLSTQELKILEPLESLSLNIITKKDITCYKSQDGLIAVAGQGGWHDGDFSYRMSPSTEWKSGNSFSIKEPGTYTIEVKDNITDAGNSEVIRSVNVTVNEPNQFSLGIPLTKDVTCNASTNGWVKVSPVNGLPAATGFKYTLLKSDESVVDTADRVGDYYYCKLAKGQYKVMVSDSHLCGDTTDLFTISEPEIVTIESSNNYIREYKQSTGEVTSTIRNGSGYYQYKWYKNDELLSSNDEFTTGNLHFTGLGAGIYRLEVKDTANCQYEGSEWMSRKFDIVAPQQSLVLNADILDPVRCNGLSDGRVHLLATGGWGEYLYRPAGGVYSSQVEYPGLKAGSYSFDVMDSAKIETHLTVKVVEPDTLIASLSHIEQVKCHDGNNGAITMNISGGNGEYEISSNNIDFQKGNVVDSLIARNYTVYIRDAKKCAISKSPYIITQPDAVSIRDTTITKSRCLNSEGSIVANFTGGTGDLLYKWQIQRILDDGSTPLVDTALTTPSIFGLPSGKYHLTISDANSCPFKFSFDVDDITDLNIYEIVTDSVTCYGYSDGWAKATVIKGNPAYKYLWPDNKATIYDTLASGYKAGTYSLLVQDSKKCNTSSTFTIKTPDTLGYQTRFVEQPLCYGGKKGMLTVLATGGTPLYGYSWSTGSTSNEISSLDPGIYSLTVTDSHKCNATFDFPMAYQRTIKPNLGVDANICHYNTLPLDGGDYKRFNWYSSNGFKASTRNVSLKDPGVYNLEVVDSDGCMGYDTLQVNVSYLEIAKLNTVDVSCNGFGDGSASLVVQPADWSHSILWSNNKTTQSISSLSGGSYRVTVGDSYGCGDARDFVISEPKALSLTSHIVDPLCLGVPDGQISLDASGGKGAYYYNWLHGASSSRLSKLDKGSYSLTLKDDNGCKLNTLFELNYQRSLYPDLGIDRTLCQGNQVKLYPGLFDGYKWFSLQQQVSTDTSLVVTASSDISVQVNDADGCIATDNVKVIQTATTFTPAFLAASSVEVGDTLLLVEVSQPKPLSLKWSFSLPHRIVEESDYAIKVIFDEQGTGEMMLTAFNGDCQGESWKNLLVVADSGNDSPQAGSSDAGLMFVSFIAAPNPSDGHFNAIIKLKETAAVTLYLVNIATGQITEMRKLSGLTDYNESFNINGSGQFALFAESGGERRVAKIVVH